MGMMHEGDRRDVARSPAAGGRRPNHKRKNLLRTLLQLQALDLKIEMYKAREEEIPKQKEKFDVQRTRLAAELAEREEVRKNLQLEQRECEGEFEQSQVQANKYEQQLMGVKENDQYQALLHEIDFLKKQIALKEERIITLMVEIDDATARLEEDKKRINDELEDIDAECAAIDGELAEKVEERRVLEREREPLVEEAEQELLTRYDRIRSKKRSGPAVVPLNGEVCTGCNMYIPPQMANEVMAGETVHTCNHCGRLLYFKENFPG